MIRRFLALVLVGAMGLAGFALAQEPAAKDEPPVRLKKKKPRGDEKQRVEPDKSDEKKADDKAEKKDDKKPEPRESEPVTPQEEEKEVLQRVVQNVHNVGDRLAKNDLGEATQQTQRDILKDLESLIQRNENSQGGGEQDQNQGDGEADQNQQNGGGQAQKQQGNKSGRKSQGDKRRGTSRSKNQGKSYGRNQSGNRSGSGSQSNANPRPGQGKPGSEKSEKSGSEDSDKPGGKNGKNGNGAGGDKDDHARNRAADQYKDVWGHLPQTLRAQMDAYSNPQPFMPKYDDLIKRYYRTIAEQGRRKGE